jgi:hypothetical protein
VHAPQEGRKPVLQIFNQECGFIYPLCVSFV